MSTKKDKNENIEDIEAEKAENVEFTIEKNESFSPFDEPVKERDYTSVKIDAKELQGELQEPIFQAPDISEFDLSDKKEEEEEEPIEKKKKAEPPHQFNESFSDLSSKEKKAGAEMMVDVVLDGYSKLKKGIGSLATISEKKLDKEFAEGTINPDLQLPIDERGNTVGIRDFAKEFNEQSADAFDTSQEFIDNVRPAMIRVFKKRGLGMTDEQLLAYHFGTDLVTSGITAFGLKKSADGILFQLREQTDILRSPKAPAPQAQANQAQAQAQAKAEFEKSQEESKEQSQKEFNEPEERVSEVQPNILVPKKNPFDAEMEIPSNMPKSHSEDILSKIDEIANNGDNEPKQIKKGRGRPKKNQSKQ